MEVDDNDQEKEYEKKKKGPLHSLFFGKLKREVFHQNKEGILELSTEQTEDFLSIFLNPVSSNELYGAWDEEFVSFAENEQEDGTKEVSKLSTWITETPRSLFFSISWAQQGEKGSGEAKKLNKKFEFEEVIYADRYMIENKVRSEQARIEVFSFWEIIKK